MTVYQTIINQENFLTLIQKKLIPVHILDWKVYYENYLQEMERQERNFSKPTKKEAIAIVAERYNISTRNLERIIAYMECD